MSTPNPDELNGGTIVPKPLSADGQRVQKSILTAAAAFSDGTLC